jgi:hypothetical protein
MLVALAQSGKGLREGIVNEEAARQIVNLPGKPKGLFDNTVF